MNVYNNGNFSSDSRNDCHQYGHDQFSGSMRGSRSYNSGRSVDLEPYEELERCQQTFRSMNNKYSEQSSDESMHYTFQKEAGRVEDTKLPFDDTRHTSSDTSQRTKACTDAVLEPPPTVQPTSPMTTQRHAEQYFHRHAIEVGTDFIPMAGVDETSHAHKAGRTIDTACVECNTVMFIIQSASMTLCPVCRCVSSIDGDSKKKILPTTNIHVGIGLTIDYVLGLE